jgi:hypothetical protein
MAATPSLRKAALVFTFGRIGLFVAVALIVYAVGELSGSPVNGAPLLLISLLVSSVLGFVLLRHQRDQFSRAIAESRDAKTAELAARRARLEESS